ncbi:sensor histidine kinase [Loktanella sp. D2R18]|uniref:sensor histidine kinase n=1 Tax=Rhodobacterales TaxID=204455 RepID=UPI000DEB7CCD|nr:MULTISPECIES: HAMP domain-containing sensor histidine kinase [Rhodobacterales]MDO6591773.1 HAMP domain-containing sensor histidine kinase [Yoonia sp. 1_MG-2023]RBW42308.1 sensor histidine kinase [Loktanella sp. D2R18]
MTNSLSGRFLILTVIFVMLAEIFIFVPSIARFRQDYLVSRLERAQLASLALEADDMISPALEAELLTNAEVYNVVLRRDDMRQLVLSSPIPSPITATYDMRAPTSMTLIRDALRTLLDKEERVIRIIGNPVRDGGLLIEVTIDEMPLRNAMLQYGWNILILSAFISVVTAGMLFFAVRKLLVTPIKGVVTHMESYAKAPEDARQIIVPSASIKELRAAEESLQMMQMQLTSALKQKQRLAQLGSGVAKVSHDLRNILTSAQLFTDRIEGSEDPLVQRMAPKLVGSITRAVNLCENTLAFGGAEEPAPALSRVTLAHIVGDVIDSERLAAGDYALSFSEDIPATMAVRADGEQLYRVIQNLVRNARQAIMATKKPGEICIHAHEDDDCWQVTVSDTGPGLPPKAQEHLFQPFQGGVRKGGSGLGLVIAGDLIRGHGGRLRLQDTGPSGTTFVIELPKADLALIQSNE